MRSLGVAGERLQQTADGKRRLAATERRRRAAELQAAGLGGGGGGGGDGRRRAGGVTRSVHQVLQRGSIVVEALRSVPAKAKVVCSVHAAGARGAAIAAQSRCPMK